jgi:PHD/YefM family antitoxin component YafN of YafNO toxin-antitoxin module
MSEDLLEPSEEAKRVLSPEELERLREALADFKRDILDNTDPDRFSKPMPPGKADFPHS